MTAAAFGQVGKLRRDPMAMLPFCGYHMGDYFAHWLQIGTRVSPDKLPRIYYTNWFRKSPDNRWLWPGFGENCRVLKWIFERVTGEAAAVDTALGRVPAPGALDISGLDVPAADLAELVRVDPAAIRGELPGVEEHYAQFGARLPPALRDEVATMVRRLG
jgi:phosphoenolpyruvate carboxykinase (GTP)